MEVTDLINYLEQLESLSDYVEIKINGKKIKEINANIDMKSETTIVNIITD